MMKRSHLIVTTTIFLFLCYSVLYHHPYARKTFHEGLTKVQHSFSSGQTGPDAYDAYSETIVPSLSAALSATEYAPHKTLSPPAASHTSTTIAATSTTAAGGTSATGIGNDEESKSVTAQEDQKQSQAGASEPKQLEEFDPSLYIQAIVSAEDTHFPRLVCPVPTTTRYDYLKADNGTKPKYFFALDLHQSAKLLPRLLGTVVETMRFLGPESCELSVVEGRSTDGTPEILKELKSEIEALGAGYHLTFSDINPLAGEGTDRIKQLADLRNLALAPLFLRPESYDLDTTVLFINDIALCMEDLLELLHQKEYQKADMTCAMDWINNGANFYDVWIGRGMNGDQFFEIPQSGGWEYAGNLFWNDGETRDRLNHGKPFQVFSCWNGVTAFTAKPLLEKQIKFRGVREHECYLGEPVYFCKDLWKLGYGRIAVVPIINVGYSDEDSYRVKEWHGTVSKWLVDEKPAETLIEWKDKPPANIKCVPTYQAPSWVPWDE